MIEFFFRLVGVHIDKAAHLARWSVHPRGTIPGYWLLLAAIVLAAAVFWMYSRVGSHVSRGRRLSLAAIRIVFLAALLLLLLRPVLRITLEGSVRRSLLLLVDDSASMNQQDKRTEADDVQRAAIALGALGPSKGLNQPLDSGAASSLHLDQVARLDLVKGALKNQKLALIDRLSTEYDIRPFSFGRSLRPAAVGESDGGAEARGDTESAVAARKGAIAAWVRDLKAPEQATAVGDAIRDAISQTRGQPLAGIWIITDGQSNIGSAVPLAADRGAQAGVPVYAYGVGITTPKDIVVADLSVAPVCFVDDDVPVNVHVRQSGMDGQTVHLNLKLGDEMVDGADVTFDATGEQYIPLKFKPAKQGEYDLTARIDPLAEEANKDNNQYTRHIKVVDKKIKVLYVEQQPRWEFKYLFAMLQRDRRVDLKCLLVEGDPGIAAGDKTPFLKTFPADKEELGKYDLLILGDVDPKTFNADQMNNIHDFNSTIGGGLLMIAGRKFMPWAYGATPLDDLLPVNVEEERTNRPGRPIEPAAESGDQPIRLEITPDGNEDPLMPLSDKPEENQTLWSKLPPVFWDARVASAKKLAKVLLVDPNPAKESRDGQKMPVIAIQRPGAGPVMFVGTDNTWRWRRNVGDRYYVALWGQIVQRLSLPHLLGESKKTQLSADKLVYSTGDPVTIFANLYDQSFKPIDKPEVRGFAVNDGQPPVSVTLRPVPGGYRASFPAGLPGNWTFYVESDPETKLNFTVTELVLEKAESAMNDKGLKELCATSGGEFFREETLNNLPDSIHLKNERVQSTFESELCFTWSYFLLLIALVTAEWLLRKTCQLK